MKPSERSQYWAWQVSFLLLLATMINYMDRQTLANVAPRVTAEFELSEKEYGNIEMAFGFAFAFGSLLFGFLVDRISVRILYPIALFGWSVAGILTGLSQDYDQMLLCRTLLGLFEAGHWPCALVTTQRLLTRSSRTMGNSVLQSGASLGAVLTPIIITLMISGNTAPGVWRYPFFVIGATGALWIFAWLYLVRPGDLAKPAEESATFDATEAPPQGWLPILLDRRFHILLVMVICLNTTWQLVRAWLPKILIQGRGYTEETALYFNSGYYVAADIGCLLAGAATLFFAKRGLSVHNSRLLVYLICAGLTSLTFLAAKLPAGLPLMIMLLFIAAGSLGLFPCYYSFTQDLSTQHMGKVTGLLASAGWFVSSPFQRWFGGLADSTGSFDAGFALTGLPPLFALIFLVFLWPRNNR